MIRGRRLPVAYGTRGLLLTQPSEPGDYCGPVHGYTGDDWAVYFIKPHAQDEGTPAHGTGVQHVIGVLGHSDALPGESEPEGLVFREQIDGTLTISGVIEDTGWTPTTDESDGWRGHLTRGWWMTEEEAAENEAG